MKKRIIAIAVAAFSAASLAAPSVDIPQDILGKQRHTLEHYGSKSKTPVPKAVAEGYSYRIGNMIKSLTASKARFDSQKGTTQPSNPYAKYNGVWQQTLHSATYKCANGNSVAIPTAYSKARFSVANNGVISSTIIELPPAPAGFRVISEQTFEHRIFGDGSYRARGEGYAYADEAGYYTTYSDVQGKFSSSNSMSGTASLRFIYHDFAGECWGSPRATMTKVNN
jgi:hypothetical protein